MELSTCELGNLSEAALVKDLISYGYSVLKPCFGHDYKYDLVIEETRRNFKTVQVKTGRYRNGVIVFDSCARSIAPGHTKGDYHGEVDYFGVFCPELNKSYLVPVAEVGIRQVSLRVDPPSKTSKKIRLAIQYELRFRCETNGRVQQS